MICFAICNREPLCTGSPGDPVVIRSMVTALERKPQVDAVPFGGWNRYQFEALGIARTQ